MKIGLRWSRRSALGLAVLGVVPVAAHAVDSSPPVVLQWFENSWQTIEKRTPDYFMAGYGAVWTPPPGRALNTAAGGGIGYDIYDRFDLGTARDETLYGTETGYKTLIKSVQRTGGSVYVDYVHHHVGSFDSVSVPSGAPTVQTRNDYPGFVLSTPSNTAYPLDGDTYQPTPPNTDQNSPQFQYQYRLANLITLNFTQSNSNSFVRNPVPGFNNVPQSSANWAVPTATRDGTSTVQNSTLLRQANTPTEANRRFYPDLQGPVRYVVDGGVTYPVYDYNSATPSAGDPTSEGTAGYMMRYAQWMVQNVGVDGLRIDAARHVPMGASGDADNPTQVNVPYLIDRAVAGASTRYNLDGTQRSVFQFQEVFSGDSNLLQSLTRKSAQSGDTTNPNRDVLDFPMWFAMRDNLSSNGGQNNWYNIRNSSQDNRDDGLAHNGSQSIHFVNNHDEGGVYLSNVAYAWTMMQPGNAYVYFKGDEFKRPGNSSFFLKDGRGDALGGQYGNLITKLVDIRNSYGRGNFAERYIDGGSFSNIYAFERVGSSVVGLSSDTSGAGVTSFDERTMYCAFVPGTRLIELTGNAADSAVDPNGQIPELITVANTDNSSLGSGKVTLRIPRNQNVNGVSHGKGYVMYGLPRPVGTLSVSNVSQTLAAEAQSASDNSTGRITAVDVVTANTFNLTLATSKVVLSDSFHDSYADGDRALFKVNEGLDLNNSGAVDNISSNFANTTVYGFENFSTTNLPGYNQASGNGTYVQTIDASKLPEGYNYVTARAWRHQGATESEVYSDFRKVIYVDRLKPQSTVTSTAQYGPADATRDLQITSTDSTANSVHVLLDLPANLNDAQVLALLNSGNHATQIDRNLFSLINTGTTDGNHVLTVVSYEITGNLNVQRYAGQRIVTGLGLGFGDLNFDNTLAPADMTTLETVLNSGNSQFNAAADVNGDGLVNTTDLTGLRSTILGGSTATQTEYQRVYNGQLVVGAGWAVNASGNWSTLDRWDTVAPNRSAATATFGAAITSPQMVTLDVARTVGTINFSNNNKYTLSGSQTLTLSGASSATISSTQGSHDIAAPLSLQSNTTFSVTNAVDTIKLGNLQDSSVAITKTGNGTLEVNRLRTSGAVSVNAGKVKITNSGSTASVSRMTSLSINPAARLDITNNAIILPAGAQLNGSAITVERLRAMLLAGRGGTGTNGGDWNGAGGIGSSVYSDDAYDAIGYVWNADPNLLVGVVNVNGYSVGATDYVVKYTASGDADLNGIVDDTDVAVIGLTYDNGSTTGHHWYEADFNYDGIVSDDDVAIIGLSYNPDGTPLSPAYYAPLGESYAQTAEFSQTATATVVPEPAMVGLVVLGGMVGLRRRRK